MIRGFGLDRTRSRLSAESIPAHWVVALFFTLSFPVLAFNAAPGVTFHDSGEFALALHSVGIPHSPGAPTWMLVNLLFKMFAFGSEAVRAANLCSAFCGSLTIAFASTFVFRHFGDRPAPIRWLSALVTSLAIMGTGAFLEQSFIAEQYTLMTAIMSALLLVIQTNEHKPKLRYFYAMGLLWGLAIGNHPSQIVLGLVLLMPLLQKRKEVAVWKSLPLGLVGLATGLCTYLYLPIRAVANPLMNWGHPDNWERFVWSVTRKQWPTRPISEAPVGFVEEWLKSYNLFGEMGFVAAVLGVTGFVFAIRRAPRPFSWLFMLMVPYAALMLLGHMRQGGMDTIYIRFYGVRDWHIPLYMGLSILGAMAVIWFADMRHKVTDKVRMQFLWTASAALLIGLVIKLPQESMRGYDDAKTFVGAYTADLPDNAVVATFTDNTSHCLAYEHFVNGAAPNIFYTFGMPQNSYIANPTGAWNARHKKDFFTHSIRQFELNPLTLPQLTEKDVETRALFTEFTSDTPKEFYATALPHGFLIQLVERPTTNEEILKLDAEFLAKHPEISAKPSGRTNRSTREARAYAHLRRGLFFAHRGLWQKSKEAIDLAMAWEPNNPQVIFPAGVAAEELKDYPAAEEYYLRCMDALPTFPGPRQNLALLYLYGKDYKRALELAEEELVLTRGSKESKKLVEIITKAQQG
ncbi:MAG TPA: DUF2723 domain-containing protein [Fimbriimonas sp.]|nr:DUF2723 domain-containing protein [Fimbriimonas sp.]